MAWLKNSLLMLGSTLVVLVILEVALRAFPVTDVTRTKPLASDGSPLDVSSVTNGTISFSREWDFKNARQRKTNNAGFFSDYDYEPGKDGIFVVGDSFVEAVQVDFDQTFHQILAQKAGAQIYSLGLSGAPLSQYQAYVEAICDRYKPETIIIPIIANDFDQSLKTNAQRAGFFHYDDDGVLSPTPYEITTLREMANSSALVRYGYFHLHIGDLIRSSISESGTATAKNKDAGKNDAHDRAAGYFLEQISKTCLSPEQFVFVVDANRNDRGIYGSGDRIPYMQNFIDDARARGFRVIDLTPVMQEEFERTQKRFEFPFDGHWNADGHALVAQLLASELGVAD